MCRVAWYPMLRKSKSVKARKVMRNGIRVAVCERRSRVSNLKTEESNQTRSWEKRIKEPKFV